MSVGNLTLGFQLVGNNHWLAGTVYLENLFRALKETFPGDITLCILANGDKDSIPSELRELVNEVISYPEVRRWTWLWAVGNINRRLFRRDFVRRNFLKQHCVKVIAFGQAPLGSKLPTFAWLPDFQHVRLPDMFSPEERQSRDRTYLWMAANFTRVILLSETVRHDFEEFIPQYASKARVVRPVSIVSSSAYDSDPRSMDDLYRIPKKFVYLPNQFWKHKNHVAAFRALKILKHRGISVFLVCSGSQVDYRHPTYFADLEQELRDSCLGEQVSFLGLIPRDHVFMLMRQSVCVLNPSLFEGYGLSVEEARSLGKQVLISDIPAHREQNPPGAIFFNPSDVEDLADKLARVWQEKPAGPDLEMESEARRVLPDRVHNYARSFMKVVQEVVN